MQKQLLIYGAAGYTGNLMVLEAVRKGIKPIIAGRKKNQNNLDLLAKEFGLEARYFNIEEASENLLNVSVLLNCAGPFSATTETLVNTCIANKIHYLDITGEIEVFEKCYNMHEQAKNQGIIIMPGVGFDIVPTDCLANKLKEALPDAERIDLAFSFGTLPSMGTVKTMVEALGKGCVIRENHQLKMVSNGYKSKKIPFQNGTKWAVTIPWGDVFTSGISTKVPNGVVYMQLPIVLIIGIKITNLFKKLLDTKVGQKLLKDIVNKFWPKGPNEVERLTQRCQFWGEAENKNGQKVAISISAPNVYSLSCEAGIKIASYCLNTTNKAGFYTPSMLLGTDFISQIPTVKILTLTK